MSEHETLNQLIALQSKIFDLQSKMFELQSRLLESRGSQFQLQETNSTDSIANPTDPMVDAYESFATEKGEPLQLHAKRGPKPSDKSRNAVIKSLLVKYDGQEVVGTDFCWEAEEEYERRNGRELPIISPDASPAIILLIKQELNRRKNSHFTPHRKTGSIRTVGPDKWLISSNPTSD